MTLQCCIGAQPRRCRPQSWGLRRSAQRLRRRRRRPGNLGALVADVHLSVSSCLRCTLGLWSTCRCTWLALVWRARCCSTRTARLPPPKPAASSVRGARTVARVLPAVALLTAEGHCPAPCVMRPSVFWPRSWRKGARAATLATFSVVYGLLSCADSARSFRRLPEDEQVALVERLLRRAIASDASNRGVRSELQTAPPSRQRLDAEPIVEPDEAPVSRKALPARTNGPASAPGVEPTSVLDAQDGWDGAAPSDASPLSLELEKLLPSAPTRTPSAAVRSPAAGTAPLTPADVTVASQAGSDTLFSRGLSPLAAAAAAGAAAVLCSVAVWQTRGRAADAPPPQAAPADVRPQAPPETSAGVAALEGVEAAATRRREVLWSRKEKPSEDASAADADRPALGVLWKRGAPRAKPVATDDAPTAAGDAKEPVGVAELSDNAEGLRFGARLKQPPK